MIGFGSDKNIANGADEKKKKKRKCKEYENITKNIWNRESKKTNDLKIFANAPSEMHCSGSSVDYIIHEEPPLFRTWNLLRLQKDKKEIRRKDKTTENSSTNRQIVHRSFFNSGKST